MSDRWRRFIYERKETEIEENLKRSERLFVEHKATKSIEYYYSSEEEDDFELEDVPMRFQVEESDVNSHMIMENAIMPSPVFFSAPGEDLVMAPPPLPSLSAPTFSAPPPVPSLSAPPILAEEDVRSKKMAPEKAKIMAAPVVQQKEKKMEEPVEKKEKEREEPREEAELCEKEEAECEEEERMHFDMADFGNYILYYLFYATNINIFNRNSSHR